MKQLEIEFFYPLTEQMSLDLDFTKSIEYQQQKTIFESYSITSSSYGSCSIGSSYITNTGSSYITNSNTLPFRPDYEAVGHIEVTPDFHVYTKKKPNWLSRFAINTVFGWKWKDK